MSVWRLLRRPEYLVALGVLTGSALGMSAAISYFKLYLRKEPIYPADGRLVSGLPIESPSWIRRGSDNRMPPEIEEVLGTQNYISRVYQKKEVPAGAEPFFMNVHAAYYTGMIDTVPHVPDRCMVGAGLQLESVVGDVPLPLDRSLWIEDDDVPAHLKGRIFKARTGENDTYRPNTRVRLPLDPQNIKLRVMKFSGDGSHPIYAGYFFVANGGVVSRAEEVRLLAFDLKSSYAYYLKVEFQSNCVNSPEELAAAAGQFLDENFAALMLTTPDWVEVEAGRYPVKADVAGSVRNEVPAGADSKH